MSSGGGKILGPELIRPEKNLLVVGRDRLADVVLAHPGVSRRHAELRQTNGRLVVHDNGSRFGTRVNSERIKERVLQDGDRVDFGPVAYEFRARQLRLLLEPNGLRLETTGLAVKRDGRLLLSDVNLSIKPNQFVGVLGPSGSGKSTLIKCLAGYVPPSSGSARFEDLELLSNLESYRTTVGYVPQDDITYGLLTCRENLEYALRLRVGGSLRRVECTDVVEGVLKRLRLNEHADKRAAVLSGGQRKRLNVATELLSRPRILFLDEPTSGLDPAGETRLMRLLKELAGSGITVVCSTHVMDNLCLFDQVLVVANETLEYAGPPRDMLSRFEVQGYAELYESLESGSHARLPREDGAPVRANARDVLEGVQLVKIEAPLAAVPPPRINLAAQVRILFMRGAKLIGRDRWLWSIFIAQPLVIGLLINLSQLMPYRIEMIYLFAVVASIWLGLNNTAREVVRDRKIYVRERLLGVTPEGYLGAKCLLYATAGLIQLCLLIALIRYANVLPKDDAKTLLACNIGYLLIVLWGAYLSAMLLGLLVSTLSNSQETAVAFLPLIILPQLLLTGEVTKLVTEKDGSFQSLVILFSKMHESTRGFMRWVAEIASLPTYSRPALTLLQKVLPADSPWPPETVYCFDGLHLLALFMVTAVLLLLAFHWRERQWLKEA